MRFLILSLVFAVAGCSQISQTPEETEAKSSEGECSNGSCCSNLTRASVLKKSLGQEDTKHDEQTE
jgi:hypothetical protein